MVRLKEENGKRNHDRKSVSIPYGSIKSFHPHTFCLLYQVSIPYGSIKSPIFLYANDNTTSFQFLMVRLKDRIQRIRFCGT